MAVADVPVTELAGLRCRGQDLISTSDLSAHCVPPTTLLDHKLLIIGEDQGQIGLSGFVHAASIRGAAGFGKRRGRFSERHSGLPEWAESDSIAKRRILCALRLQDPGTFP